MQKQQPEINGIYVEWPMHMTKWTCDTCTTELDYSDKWDAEYCPKCNAWKNEKCGVTSNEPVIECYFECWKRPERPDEKQSEV